ncbi:MAG: T9SS type A sorting domain-containing protein [Bacteroidia bacterium]|nr:T9SS type A sorting domain-containing protein [Bacteroidia bacterium]
MKIKFFLILIYLLIILINNNAKAQIQADWITYGPNGLFLGSDIDLDNIGNIYIIGSCVGPSLNKDILLIKCNTKGDTLWSIIYNGSGNMDDYPYKITVQNSYIYAMGITMDTLGKNIFMLKYDTLHTLQWATEYHVGQNPRPLQLMVSDSGNVYITGVLIGVNFSFFTMKFNTSGDFQWINYYYTNWNSGSYNCYIAIDHNENCYITTLEEHNLITEFVTIKYNPAGIQQWTTIYTHPDATANTNNFSTGISVDSTGNVYVAGRFSYFNSGYNMLLIKYNSSGDTLWTSVYNRQDDSDDEPEALHFNSDGNIYLAGISSYSINEIVILKYDTNGNILSTEISENIPIGWYIIKTDINSNFYACGEVYESQDLDESYIYTIKCDANAEKLWDVSFKNSYGINYPSDIETDDNGNTYVLGTVVSPDGTSSNRALIKYCDNCNSIITGNIFSDGNQNCIKDSNETILTDWIVKADPGPYFANTDTAGNYIMYLPHGNFIISENVKLLWNQVCTQYFNISTLDSSVVIHNINFANKALTYCPQLWINIATTHLRKCFINKYAVNYCNTGTSEAPNSYIEISFPPEIIPLSSSLPWSSQTGNIYRFNIGTIDVGDCSSFYITDSVSCEAEIGQTLCVQAHIYPDSLCFPVDSLWDHSSIEVEGFCNGDSLVCFTIYNTGEAGDGDMSGISIYRVYTDNIMFDTGTFQITGDSLIKCYPATGQTIRFEADQRPGHPGNSHPNAVIELCGDSQNPSLGFVTAMPEDDEDPFVEIDCGEVVASFDPNEKLVKPKGITDGRFIPNGTQLEYHVNFQNTGTDAAFSVVIRDTLSQYLNVETIEFGVTSHPCTYSIFGAGILEWKFHNIILPDSNINEPESHGFIKYKVRLKQDLANGTLIENKAGIIFDYNAPVMTNTAWNTVYDTTLVMTVPVRIAERKDIFAVYPNPARKVLTIQIKTDYTDEIEIDLINSTGMVCARIFKGNVQKGTEKVINFKPEQGITGLYLVRMKYGDSIEVRKVVFD